MDKKGHIYMGKFIVNTLIESDIDCNFFTFSKIGNIFPDLKPSFLNMKHNMEETLYIFEKILEDVSAQLERMTRLTIFKIGEVSHYLADYFILPHNPEVWNGNLIQHIKYELNHHRYLKKYLKNKEFEEDLKNFKFNKDIDTFDELLVEIKNKHNEYLLEEQNILIDCKYIVCMTYHVLRWIIKQIFNKDIEKKLNYLVFNV